MGQKGGMGGMHGAARLTAGGHRSCRSTVRKARHVAPPPQGVRRVAQAPVLLTGALPPPLSDRLRAVGVAMPGPEPQPQPPPARDKPKHLAAPARAHACAPPPPHTHARPPAPALPAPSTHIVLEPLALAARPAAPVLRQHRRQPQRGRQRGLAARRHGRLGVGQLGLLVALHALTLLGVQRRKGVVADLRSQGGGGGVQCGSAIGIVAVVGAVGAVGVVAWFRGLLRELNVQPSDGMC